jgi:hypothetical protein
MHPSSSEFSESGAEILLQMCEKTASTEAQKAVLADIDNDY